MLSARFNPALDALDAVIRLRETLLSADPAQPEDLLAAIPDLEAAIAALPKSSAEPGDLVELKAELVRTANLIERGLEFHHGWARIFGAASAGYTPSGDAAALSAEPRVSVSG